MAISADDQRDTLVIEIDGPGASPEAADPSVVLDFASAMVALINANAEESDVDLSLLGLSVFKKCIAVAVGVNRQEAARECAALSLRQIAGTLAPPRGLSGHVTRAQEAARRLPPGQMAQVIVGPWVKRVTLGAPRVRPLDSILSIRATPIRVGGVRAAVRFTSPLESPFTLNTTKTLAKDIGKHLYQPLDIEALVERDADGMIMGGKLTFFRPMDEGDPVELWRSWYRSVTEPGAGDADHDAGRSQ